MENKIIVRIDIEDCIKAMNNALTNYDNLEDKFLNLTSKIADTSKWKGEAQVKADNIHALLNEYQASLRQMYDEFQKCIVDLSDSADSFTGYSYNVTKLQKNW